MKRNTVFSKFLSMILVLVMATTWLSLNSVSASPEETSILPLGMSDGYVVTSDGGSGVLPETPDGDADTPDDGDGAIPHDKPDSPPSDPYDGGDIHHEQPPGDYAYAPPDDGGAIPPRMPDRDDYAPQDNGGAIPTEESDSPDGPPNDGGNVPGEVLAPADSLEHAQTIADAYGLELISYAYGIAVLSAADPVLAVAGSGNTRGIPKLSPNRLHQLHEIIETSDLAKDAYKPMPAVSDPDAKDAQKQAEQMEARIAREKAQAEQTEAWAEQGKTRAEQMEAWAEHEKARAEQGEAWTEQGVLSIVEQESAGMSYSSIQWHHAEMDTDRAWPVSTGQNVIIAVIDTGIDLNHPALAGKISDLSYNSHTDEIGLQYVQDDHPVSHGTHVSGIAAATFDAVADISGIAPDAKILTIKSNDPGAPNFLQTASWLRGLNYAVANGAQVVNMSFGSYYYVGGSDIERQVIANAVAAGVTLVSSAGNDSSDHAGYPAAYPECIAVSATRQGYAFAGFSNYGPEIAVAAPGESIYSSVAGGGYGYLNGTSMASPNVAGVAALVIALHPGYSPQQVREVLCGSARDAGALGRDDYFGHGIVNAYAAVLGLDSLYDVTFDFNDGIHAPVTIKVIPNSVLVAPSIPIMDGYVFDGWLISGTNEEFDFGSPVQGNIKLDAMWAQLADGMYLLEFPDSNFRREVLRLLNAMDDGKRKDSYLVVNDLSLLASIEYLNVESMSIYNVTGLKYLTGLELFYCNNNYLTALDVSNNTNLVSLDCEANWLAALDVSKNTNLVSLDCWSNWLTVLDVSKNTKLESLDCGANWLTALNVTKNAALTYLYLSHNQLTELDVSGNPDLESLFCWNNRLAALDISQNILLHFIDCDGNGLTALDVSNNTLLVHLDCRNNRLTKLNIINNTMLEKLYCYRNLLTELDVSNNANLNILNCTYNFMKSVDDVIGWQAIPALVPDVSFYFYPQCAGTLPSGVDITGSFKDPAFLAAVRKIANKPEGPILDYDVAQIDYLYVNLWDTENTIFDLSGIEHFGSLTVLECDHQQLVELDLSNNTILEYVYCMHNKLKMVDVSHNLQLRSLQLDGNSLTSLDVSNNAKLVILWLDYNQLTSLDLSNNSLLESVWCRNNILTELDLSSCSMLQVLYCSSNYFAGLDISDCVSLYHLDCRFNFMESVDNVIGWQTNPYLILYDSFRFYPQYFGAIDITDDFIDPNFRAAVYNAIGKPDSERIYNFDAEWVSWLDVSYWGIQSLAGLEWFTGLNELRCGGNQLVTLPGLPGGLEYLTCWNNQLVALPELPGGLIALDCDSNQLTTLPELPHKLRDLYCNNNQLALLPKLPDGLESLFCWNNQLEALSGLPDSLINLNCGSNLLALLPGLPDGLYYLACPDNQLVALPTLPHNLRSLVCAGNQLASLPELPDGLENLNCSYNQLESLPVLPISLMYLYCNENQLTGFKVDGLSLLHLDCRFNYMESADDVIGWQTNPWLVWNASFRYHPQYTYMIDITDDFIDPNFRAAVYNTIGKNPSERIYNYDVEQIYHLNVSYRGIQSLAGLGWFSGLEYLDCSGNQLLSLPELPGGLRYLYCWYNQLEELPELPGSIISLNCSQNHLSYLPKLPDGLEYLDCWANQIEALPALPDSLTHLSCENNQLSTLSMLPYNLRYLNCGNNQLAQLPVLPEILTDLYCYNNQITMLPTLPKTLKTMHCGDNPLAVLPELPDELVTLYCYDNQLEVLPMLPKNLKYLYCANNPLAVFPELPKGLETLYCHNNQLDTLPTLPKTLITLYCGDNSLAVLPELPDGLETLYCFSNQLDTLPTLPKTLQFLYCENNLLTVLPELPKGLEYLYCRSNLLTGFDVTGLSLFYINCSNNYIPTPFHVIGFPIDKWDNNNYIFYPQNIQHIDITDYFTDPVFLAAVYSIIGKAAPERVYYADVMEITSLDIPDMGIQSLAGLEWFVSLKELFCESNKLTFLDISKNPALVRLDCYSNKLTELIVSAGTNPMLLRLYCYDNYLRDPDSFVGWRELGLVINTPQSINSGTYRFYNQNNTTSINVKGIIRSYNPQIPIVIRLMQGNNEMYKVTIEGTAGYGQTDQSFAFEGVAPGNYTLVISKALHTRFTVERIAVGNTNVDLTEDIRPEVRLMTLLCGDINGDGEINQADLNILWLPANYNKPVAGGANMLCDLNGDGEINQLDLNILWLPSNYNEGAVLIK